MSIAAVVLAVGVGGTALVLFAEWPVQRALGLAFVGLTLVGIVLAVSAEQSSGWVDVGRGLFISGVFAVAVWTIEELRRDREERQNLRMTVGLQQDLSGVDLRGEDLSEFELAGKNFTRSNFAGADLRRANLVGTTLTQANLEGARLSSANLTDAVLDDARLVRADLSSATLLRAQAHRALLWDANLTNANLMGAKLGGACLAEADLVRADLTGADLERAVLNGAILDGAVFETDFRGANMQQISLAAAVASNVKWPRGFDPERLLAGRSAPIDHPEAPPTAALTNDEVVEINDGDTVLLRERGPVRLIGLDAPEAGSPHDHATSYLERRIPPGSRVTYEFGVDRLDRFGRRLVFIWLRDGGLLNARLVEEGLATALRDPPNTKYDTVIQAAEQRARERGRGIWQSCPALVE